MRKESRLSFRISDKLSSRIENAINSSGGQIRDRSEFGTKATLFYLDYIENIDSEEELLINSILALAKKVNLKNEHTKKLEKLVTETKMVPSVLSSNKAPEAHPDFDKLLARVEELEGEEKEFVKQEMVDATYSDIPNILKKVS